VNGGTVLGLVTLLFAGILAGEEFTIRYGVRAAVASLDDRPHIQLRQALIRRLVVVVPVVFALTLLSGVGATVLNGFDLGFGFRCAGVLALLAFISVTLAGTVPINSAALGWDPGDPPANWRTMVGRWERFDTVRFWAALTASVLFLMATALQLAAI
jgi:uncharacterized membrane protein